MSLKTSSMYHSNKLAIIHSTSHFRLLDHFDTLVRVRQFTLDNQSSNKQSHFICMFINVMWVLYIEIWISSMMIWAFAGSSWFWILRLFVTCWRSASFVWCGWWSVMWCSVIAVISDGIIVRRFWVISCIVVIVITVWHILVLLTFTDVIGVFANLVLI